MDYFRPVVKLPRADRESAYRLFEAWEKKTSQVSPANGVKKISKDRAKQQTLLKFIGLLSVAGPRKSLLVDPSLQIIQMRRTSDKDRLIFRNLIMSELRRIKGRRACVGELHQTTDHNLLRVIMVRGKLGGDSEFGSNFVASVVHVFPGTPPEAVVYNLAFKQMPMKTGAKQIDFERKTVMQELRIMEECTRLVENGTCPNLPIVYKWWECPSCVYWNPKLKKPHVPKSCLMMANELSTGGDLKGWMLKGHSQVAWQSCIFQMLAGLVAYHNILGYMHDDMHHGNVLYDIVEPGGYWHYRFMTSSRTHKDIWVPNTGQLWKLWDFGLSRKISRPRSVESRQEMACDAMRILGIITEPEGREKGMPSKPVKNKIAKMVEEYEETGICDEEMEIDEDALPVFTHTPAFDIMLRLGWFGTRPRGRILNESPFQMKAW